MAGLAGQLQNLIKAVAGGARCTWSATAWAGSWPGRLCWPSPAWPAA